MYICLYLYISLYLSLSLSLYFSVFFARGLTPIEARDNKRKRSGILIGARHSITGVHEQSPRNMSHPAFIYPVLVRDEAIQSKLPRHQRLRAWRRHNALRCVPPIASN